MVELWNTDRSDPAPEHRLLSATHAAQELIAQLADERAVDHIVRTRALEVGDVQGRLVLRLPPSACANPESVVITPHGLAQMCELVALPLPADYSVATSRAAMALELQRRLRALDRKMVVRCWRGELRAFVADGFPRRSPRRLCNSFLTSCAAHGARPIGALRSATRSVLHCARPELLEVDDGQYVALGATFEHSEYGDGPLRVSAAAFCLRAQCVTVLLLQPISSEVLQPCEGPYNSTQYETDLRRSSAQITEAVLAALSARPHFFRRLRAAAVDSNVEGALAHANIALELDEAAALHAGLRKEPRKPSRLGIASAVAELAERSPLRRSITLQSCAGQIAMRAA